MLFPLGQLSLSIIIISPMFYFLTNLKPVSVTWMLLYPASSSSLVTPVNLSLSPESVRTSLRAAPFPPTSAGVATVSFCCTAHLS